MTRSSFIALIGDRTFARQRLDILRQTKPLSCSLGIIECHMGHLLEAPSLNLVRPVR